MTALPTTANHVYAFRTSRGWTQAQAAKWYGCHERTWRRWELGEVQVPAPVIKRLAATRIAKLSQVG